MSIPTEEALALMGGNPMGRQSGPKRRELSDSERERLQGVRDRLVRRSLFPSAFLINAGADIKFLLSLLGD